MNAKMLTLVLLSLLIGAVIGYAVSLSQTATLRSQISTLQSDMSRLESEISGLANDYDNLEMEYDRLTLDYESLNESLGELTQEYADLLFHYNLINDPVSNFTTIEDLQVTITTYQTSYYYKDPASGNVTITYVNGTAFEGEFSIYVVPGFGGYGRTTYPQPTLTNGFAEFYLSAPVFKYGPGNYTIGMASISTVDGYVIATGLWNPCVQVEAK